MKRAAIYARVSSSEQAQGDKVSIPNQLLKCRSAAIGDGFQVADIEAYVDAGVSGAKGEGDRPDFTRLMRDVRAGSVQAVYFLALDRLSRDQIDALVALRDMENAGARVTSLREPALNDPMFRAMTAAMTQVERMTILSRTLDGKITKRNEGYWVNGSPPFGYRLDRVTKTLIQCPNEAPTVRRIFQLAMQGYGRTQIANELNSQGVPAPEIKTVNRYGETERVRVGHVIDHKPLLTVLAERGLTPKNAHAGTIAQTWSSRSVANVLENTVAYGWLEGVKQRIEPEPILTESEFQAARTAIAGRRTYQGSVRGQGLSARWLLTGFLKCEGCGSNYVHHRGRGHDRYCCGHRRSGKGRCSNPHIKMETADQAVVAVLRQFLLQAFPTTERFRDHLLAGAQSRVSDLQQQLRQAETELTATEVHRKELESCWRTSLAHGLMAEALADLRRELEQATSKLRRLRDSTAKLTREIGNIRTGLVADEKNIDEVSSRIRHSLMLISDDGDHLTDLRGLLAIMLKSAVVCADSKVHVELRGPEKAEQELIEFLATQENQLQAKMDWAISA